MWRDIFVTIAQLIVASPNAWKELDKEEKSQHEFLSHFLHPIFGIIAFATFVGSIWVEKEWNVENALKECIIAVVAIYGGYFIASYVLNELAPRFGLEKNLLRFQQFTGYSSVVVYTLFVATPLLSGVFILWLLSLYSIHLVSNGASYFVRVQKAKVTDFTAIASGVIVFSPVLLHWLFSQLIR